MNFPFGTISTAKRVIDDVMVPVIVAREEALAGEVEGLIRDLRFAQGVGGIARKLGRYTVGIPHRVRGAMMNANERTPGRPRRRVSPTPPSRWQWGFVPGAATAHQPDGGKTQIIMPQSEGSGTCVVATVPTVPNSLVPPAKL